MKRWLLLLVVALLVLSLSCSALGLGDTEETAVDEETATAAPSTKEATGSGVEPSTSAEVDESEQEPETGTDPSASGEGDLSKLNSYRARTTWQAEYADGRVEELVTEEAITRNPFALHSLTEMTKPGGGETMEVFHLGQTHWMRVDTEWIQSQGEQLRFEDNQTILYFMDYSAIIEHGDFDDRGKEKVNGLQTRHYRSQGVSTDEMDCVWVMTTLSSYSFYQDVTDLTSTLDEMWLADEPDFPAFPVRWVLEAEGKDGEGGVVKFSEVREIYDINAPFTIEPPADAPAGWPPDDVPVYTGADVDSSTTIPGGGILFFSSADDVKAVADFYQDQLTAAGWSRIESTELEGMVMNTWGKDGRTLILLISAETAGGCSVTLTETAEQ